ncbi:methylmalonyl-CoA mutase [Virgisporangium aliadipatigenens]|uniref:methylmalonyl-CoA mutase n=1 Tax=Virgisporangium aliadipatigenens TaxID=741659 RepID=A0A8J4DPR6_9ACTN|nr:methylmalonyl-CoA mutase family protein [Virgisporangium aliadipatigenens]GIJ44938.1 methylmalonyl-CoA mutase [Virgisporangium aliadipatigenens]
MTELSLAAGFPAASAQEWRRLAVAVLRKSGAAGADTPDEAVDELLATQTYDGIRLAPLHTAGTPAVRPPHVRAGAWEVRQRHGGTDAKRVNEEILADLDNGVGGVWLDGPLLPGMFDGVYLDLISVAVSRDAAGELLDAETLHGTLGLDPERDLDLIRVAVERHPGVRAVTVDGTRFHEEGASDAQELGCAVAEAVAHLRVLASSGLPVERASAQLEFRFAATADQFGTVAKLRAARLMWARVLQACGAPDSVRMYQHAVTSAVMLTARDPWTNLLRGTLACFGAGVGGADAVTVLPFDAAVGRPDGFARRIARNTQSLLIEEANVARVRDPAGGSWYVERRTAELARVAWEWFQEIERAGGFSAAADLIAERLAATWEKRRINIAHRRDPLTGLSEFPHLEEKPLVREAADGPRPARRYAADFERLRDRADAAPTRPTVFLATLGPVAAHTARVSFAANLFAAGGIATVHSGPEDFGASGTRVACICGTDKAYAEHAVGVAAALREAGATTVWLAGRPADHEGVDGYLYTGCDAIAALESTLEALA